ncbi:MAG: PhoH family protein [Candidatus Zixiibacteriota bacterium]
MPNKFENNQYTELVIPEGIDPRELFGARSIHINNIENTFGVRVVSRGDTIQIYGPKEAQKSAKELFKMMIEQLNRGGMLSQQSLRYAMDIVQKNGYQPPDTLDERIIITKHNHTIRPRSDGQRRYSRAMFENDLIFVIGPAGTGKTYLAVAFAVRLLEENQVDRLVLVRPAVEAEESLGFLPGDMKAKVDPYLRPLYDALYDMLPQNKMERYVQAGKIEVAPLAFMRGRTLNNSFIILDEGQNTTVGQMKMFLTRMGMHSKVIVTGDITQIDLKPKSRSGLLQVTKVLRNIPNIAFVNLDRNDVVRHNLVQEIIQAYEKFNQNQNGKTEK